VPVVGEEEEDGKEEEKKDDGEEVKGRRAFVRACVRARAREERLGEGDGRPG